MSLKVYGANVYGSSTVHAMKPDFRRGMKHEGVQALCGYGSYHRTIDTENSKKVNCEACKEKMKLK